MTTTVDDGADRVAEVAAELIAGMDAAAARLAEAIGAAAQGGAPGPERREAADAAAEAESRALLEGDERLFGAGFVASSAFAGEAGRMSWWQARAASAAASAAASLGDRPAGERTIARLDSAATEAGDYQRDVDAVEWYHEPLATGRPHLTGPYVDYLCTDDLTMTYTVPVTSADGETLGVVGCDIAARVFEDGLQQAIERLGAPAVVVTDEGRVIASTEDGAPVMGRLPSSAVGRFAWRPLGATPLRLGIAE